MKEKLPLNNPLLSKLNFIRPETALDLEASNEIPNHSLVYSTMRL